MKKEQILRFNRIFSQLTLSSLKRVENLKFVEEYHNDEEDYYDETIYIFYDEILQLHIKVVERVDSYGDNSYIMSIQIVEQVTKTITEYK